MIKLILLAGLTAHFMARVLTQAVDEQSESIENVSPGSFKPFEVTAAHLIYVGLGFFIVIFGMLSLFIKERLYLGEAPIALLFGIIVGPAALNLFNPVSWSETGSRAPGGHVTDEITLEVMRVTIALSVFAVGVELPKKYLLRHWRSIAMLLGPVMIYGWVITAAFIRALVPGLDFLNCLVIAACVTPTDPILAQAVVGGPWAEKHVPAHLRHMLQCESGCNDGAAFPFLYLALFLTTHRGDARLAIAEWFYDALAYQIVLGTILGAVIGWAARKAIRFSERRKWVDRESFVAQYVSLAIASMGTNVLLGSDDLLAAFACGTAFAWDGWFTKQTEDSHFSNIVDLLFNVATFVYIGALMPWYEFAHAAGGALSVWRCIVLAILVLSFKRIPVILALWRLIPDVKTFREALFSAHFGPMGVGAIFIATLGRYELPENVNEPPQNTNDVLALTIQPIVFFLVLCSVAVHGLTVPFFAFSKRAHTITRTWSRHPSMGGDGPDWINRMKRFRSTDTGASQGDVEGGGMDEIRRALNAQLGVIGKGAIGGDAEKELRGESTAASGEDSTDGSSGRPQYGLLNVRTERDLELAEGGDSAGYHGKASNADADDIEEDDEDSETTRRNNDIDDLEDWQCEEADDPNCEWGGDDTAEMKIYKAKRAAKREAAKRRKGQKTKQADDDNGDLGEAPMDRELISGEIGEGEEDEAARRDKEGQARYDCGDIDERHGGRDREEKMEMEREHEEEEHYPKARSWLEGSDLIIEYCRSKLGEPDVHVLHLDSEEADRIAQCSSEAEQQSVAAAWVRTHREELDHHVEDGSHRHWGPADAAVELIKTGTLGRWKQGKSKSYFGESEQSSRSHRHDAAEYKEEEETEDQRNERADVMYQALEGHALKPDDIHRQAQKDVKHADEDERKEIESSAAAVPAASSSSARPTSPPRARSNRKRSPSSGNTSPKASPTRQRAAGKRRSSMRKKLLSGRAALIQPHSSRGHTDDNEDEEDDDDDEAEDEVREAEGGQIQPSQSKFMPRATSWGGLGSPAEQRPGGLLRTPSSIAKDREDLRGAPSISVSFAKTDSKTHDGQTKKRKMIPKAGGLSSPAPTRSPMMSPTSTIEPPSEESSRGASGPNNTSRSTDSHSKSKRTGGGSGRFSAFLTSLTSGSSTSKRAQSDENENGDASDDGEESAEEEEEEIEGDNGVDSAISDIVARNRRDRESGRRGIQTFPMQGVDPSSPVDSRSSSPTRSRSLHRSATPGPTTMTHPDRDAGADVPNQSILSARSATMPTETSPGIESPPSGSIGGGSKSGTATPSVAFDL